MWLPKEILTEVREILSSEEGIYLKKNITDSASSGQLVNLLHGTSGEWHTFLQRITSAKWKLSMKTAIEPGSLRYTQFIKKERESNLNKGFNNS